MSTKEKLIASAQKNLEKGQIAKAVKDYQQIVQVDPRDVRSRQKLAELLSRARQNDLALEEFDKVGRHYAENGFYLKAIAVYKQMQKLDPDRSDIYFQLAELNEKQGLVGNAMAEYRTLAALYEKKKLYEDAIGVLLKMREIDAEDLNLRVKTAELYLHSGKKKEARVEVGELVQPLLQKNDYSRAKKLYEFFLPHFPDDRPLKVDLAEVLILRQENERGLHLLKELLQQDPENAKILQLLARGYRQAEDYANERLIYQHLLKGDPGDLASREGLIRASIDQRDLARALDELEEWKEAFFAAGKTDLLKTFYQDLQESMPQEAQVQASLRALSEATGEGDGTFVPPAAAEAEPGASADFEEEFLDGSVLDEAVEDLEIEDLEEIAEVDDTAPESPVVEEMAEEIPLEFLQDIEEAADRKEPEELELELELEDGEAGYPVGGDPPEVVELEIEAPDLDPLAAEGEPGEGAGWEAGDSDLDHELELADVVEEEDDLGAEMEELEFYLQQGLLDEAERLCQRLLARFPGNSELLSRSVAIGEIRQRSAGPEGGRESADPEANVAENEIAGAAAGFLDLDDDDLDAAVSFFDPPKKGIKTEVEVEDPESHYHLGIAYKEMGLLDDAISEFEKAMQDPTRAVDCLMLQGICLAEKGALEQAEGVLKAGLGRPDLVESEKISLHYELGELYEAMERPLEALDSYQFVGDRDLFFRNVGERIANLRERLGLGDEAMEAGGKKSKSRVSYV